MFFNAEAKVDKEKNVLFGENKIKAKNIIIATGSSPAELPIEGINSKNVMNSDTILEMTSLPQSFMHYRWRSNRHGICFYNESIWSKSVSC
ncbi:FAD-dependent pyridine nucleotide-disulfide oxidoreductase [Thermoanaerobacter ethanolicus JW 200]|nr:FAD-dependent pyridine nucleotide-disulfide oxidoreductase [Thermoanaerobacter ethanolicus JW 200]